jgi:signal transduction histidine kinase/CheY-like chemotaxis protein
MEADERLRESQRLVDLAQEAGHVGFFHYRFAEGSLAWTAGQAMLFGIEERPPGGSLQDWSERIDAADRERVEATLRRLFGTRAEHATLEFRVTLPDGAARWLSSRVLLSYAADGLPLQMIGITVDMTDQKEAERERAALVEREQAARREAERASRAKDEFLAMLGHELRNPMSAIGSAVELLGRVPPDSEVARNARDIIERQTRHLALLLDDLLDVGRVISGKILLARQNFDLGALVERLVGTVRVTGAMGQHTLVTDLQEVWVEADATRIEQVVSNLLGNAAKYTPPGGRIEVVVRAEPASGGAQDAPGEAVLEVRDNGIGIAPELLPRVFDLFVQGERSLDRRAGGLGVGLTLVRRLVELHGGTVGVDSSAAGSCFRVRLPAQPTPAPRGAPTALPESRRRRITVIEDNQDALNALRTVLELDGHTVSSATDGVSGLAALLKLRPDIAIVDIGLPGITGLEVALRSRAAGYPGRMIAISGYGQESDVRQALKSGFDAHLVKPIDAATLRRLIAEN